MVGTVRARLTIGGLGAPGSRDFALAYFFEDRNDRHDDADDDDQAKPDHP